MLVNYRLGLVLASVAVAASVACSRKTDTAARIAIAMPFASQKAGALDATYKPTVLIVNVQGPNMPTIKREWSAHDCSSCLPPSVFVIENVPPGSGRLIQALAVHESDSGRMLFYYGDKETSLVSGDNTIDITASSFGSSGMQGHVMGRWLNTDGSGPTGRLEARFVPPNGRPEMLIMDGAMIAGWFQAFALDGDARINYYLSGTTKLIDSLHLGSSLLVAAPARARVKVPNYLRSQGDSSTQLESESRAIVGFFGPGVVLGTHKSCYDNRSGQSLSGAFKIDGVSPLIWNGAGTPSVDEAGMEAGGVGYNPTGTGTACHDANNDFISTLKVHPATFRNGHDSLAGFRGPFAGTEDAYGIKWVTTSRDGANTLTLGFQMLPGTYSGLGSITGVTVYSRVGAQENSDEHSMYTDSGVRCTALMGLGFTPLLSASLNSTQSAQTLNVPLAPVNAKLILCPYIEVQNIRSYFDAGVEIWESGPSISPSGELRLAIIGSDTMNSDLSRPGFKDESVTLLKSEFLNGFHNLAFKTGFGSYLTPSDVSNLEVTTDNGATWQTAYYGTTGYSMGILAASPAVNTGYNNDLYDLLSTSASQDTAFKVRVTVPEFVKNNFNLPSTTYTSGTITLVGSTTCPSAGTLEFVDLDTLTAIPGTGMFGMFSAGNGTDLSRRVGLRFNGCPQARLILDRVNFSGSSSPFGCFGMQDMPIVDAVSLLLSPRDSAGTTCSVFSAPSLTLTAPSNAGTTNLAATPSSITITHSTTAQKLAPLVTRNVISSIPTDYKAFYRFVALGPNLSNFETWAVKLNSDGMLTSSMGTSSSATTWTLGGGSAWTSNWFNSAPAGGARLQLSTLSSPGSTGAAMVLATDGTASGGFMQYVAPLNFTVWDATPNGFDGGSPLLLTANPLNNLDLRYFPSNSGDFNGKMPRILPLPAVAPTSGLRVGKVLLMDSGSSPRQVLVGLNYTSNTSTYFFGQVEGQGNALTINWSAPKSYSGEYLVDLVNYGGYTAFAALDASPGTSPSYVVRAATLPTFSGGSWIGGDTTGKVSFSPSNQVTDANIDGGIVGFAECRDRLYLVGTDNSYPNEFRAREIYAVSGVATLGGTLHSSSGTVSGPGPGLKVACMPLVQDNPMNEPGRLFLVYDPSGPTTNNKMFAWDNSYTFSSSQCGSSTPNQELSINGGSNSINLSSMSTGFTALTGAYLLGKGGFLGAYAGPSSTPPTQLTFYHLSSCSSGSMTTSQNNLGEMALPAGAFLGLKHHFMYDYMGGNYLQPNQSNHDFMIFGVNAFLAFELK